ncbi:hypothetical protein ACP70R_005143 [Stipagrostis hirtigluma subsp. patula]
MAKRARRAARPPPLASSDSDDSSTRSVDWAGLPSGPAESIAELLLAEDVAYFMRFRAVCSLWRTCTVDPKEQNPSDRRFHPRRWIMLPPAGPRGGATGREFLNVCTAERVRLDLPLLAGHDVAGGPAPEGLLVLHDRRSHDVRLLNPFTGLVAGLPPATALVRCAGWKERLEGRCTIAAAGTVLVYFSALRLLCSSQIDGDRWEAVRRRQRVSPSLQHHGLFTAAIDNTFLSAITGGDDYPDDFTVHMVDDAGELLVVIKARLGGAIEVFKVDLEGEPPAVRVDSLGDRALVVGSRKDGVGVHQAVPFHHRQHRLLPPRRRAQEAHQGAQPRRRALGTPSVTFPR